MAVVDARDAPEQEKEGSWDLIAKVFRSPPVLVMAVVYFLFEADTVRDPLLGSCHRK